MRVQEAEEGGFQTSPVSNMEAVRSELEVSGRDVSGAVAKRKCNLQHSLENRVGAIGLSQQR